MTDMRSIEARIAARASVAPDICALEIEARDGTPLPAFDAGAHIDVHVGGFVRQYSLLGAPGAAPLRYRIAVLKTAASRGGSEAVHARLHAGSTLRISAPRNLFPLQSQSPWSLLVAGGIGITPLLSMAQALHAAGAPFELHYCARSRGAMAFVDELLRSPFAHAVHLHPDDEAAFDAARVLAGRPADARLYVCGPQGFMDHVLRSAKAAGWDERSLHHESFQPAAAQGDRGFELVAARSGRRIAVAANETALQALRREGIEIASSCEQGVCGSCLTPVLEGRVAHRDAFLSARERALHDQFLPCCSRALGEVLTLDL